MAVSLREYRAKIRSTQSTKKITRAMELIAASRIVKAQQAAAAAAPYARELTRAVSALATFSNIEHVLTTENPDAKRAAILVIASDRGLAGAYASSVLKETEQLAERLREEIADLQAASVDGSPGTDALRLAAGAQPVQGPGIVLEVESAEDAEDPRTSSAAARRSRTSTSASVPTRSRGPGSPTSRRTTTPARSATS